MKTSRIKLIVIILVVIWIGAVIFFFINRHPPSTAPKTTMTNNQLPDQALITVKKYLQARENSVGADQSSPLAWLDTIKPISTQAFHSKLLPSGLQTGIESEDYRTAHARNYIIVTTVDSCTWDNKSMPKDITEGTLHCDLMDKTLDRTTNNEVPGPELPFGWTRIGRQPAPGLKLVKQNDTWLVDAEITGSNED